ncbi:hypothetical protein Hanom_Chr06g00540921 [Helianthus anomalus]
MMKLAKTKISESSFTSSSCQRHIASHLPTLSSILPISCRQNHRSPVDHDNMQDVRELSSSTNESQQKSTKSKSPEDHHEMQVL